MFRSVVEWMRYWAAFSFYFLLIPVTVVTYGIKLFSKPKGVQRILRHAEFLDGGFIAGRSSLQGTETSMNGFLLGLTIERGELVANIEGYRYVVRNIVEVDEKYHLHETLCELWLPSSPT